MNKLTQIAGVTVLGGLATIFGQGCVQDANLLSVNGETPKQYAKVMKERNNQLTIGVGGLYRQETAVQEAMRQERIDVNQNVNIDANTKAAAKAQATANTADAKATRNTAAIVTLDGKVTGMHTDVERLKKLNKTDIPEEFFGLEGAFSEKRNYVGIDTWNEMNEMRAFFGEKVTTQPFRVTADEYFTIANFQAKAEKLLPKISEAMNKTNPTGKDVKEYMVMAQKDGVKFTPSQKATLTKMADFYLDGEVQVDLGMVKGLVGKLVSLEESTYETAAELVQLKSISKYMAERETDATGAKNSNGVTTVQIKNNYGEMTEGFLLPSDVLAEAKAAGLNTNGLSAGLYVHTSTQQRLGPATYSIMPGEGQVEEIKACGEGLVDLTFDEKLYTANINGIERSSVIVSRALEGDALRFHEMLDENDNNIVEPKEIYNAAKNGVFAITAGNPVNSQVINTFYTVGTYEGSAVKKE